MHTVYLVIICADVYISKQLQIGNLSVSIPKFMTLRKSPLNATFRGFFKCRPSSPPSRCSNPSTPLTVAYFRIKKQGNGDTCIIFQYAVAKSKLCSAHNFAEHRSRTRAPTQTQAETQLINKTHTHTTALALTHTHVHRGESNGNM